jgi:hypothetical protein
MEKAPRHADHRGLEVTTSRPPTGAGVEGTKISCVGLVGGRSKRPVQPGELGRGASGRLVLKAFLLEEVPLGASLAGLLPRNGCSRR